MYHLSVKRKFRWEDFVVDVRLSKNLRGNVIRTVIHADLFEEGRLELRQEKKKDSLKEGSLKFIVATVGPSKKMLSKFIAINADQCETRLGILSLGALKKISLELDYVHAVQSVAQGKSIIACRAKQGYQENLGPLISLPKKSCISKSKQGMLIKKLSILSGILRNITSRQENSLSYHAKYAVQLKKWKPIMMTILNQWKFAGYVESIISSTIRTKSKFLNNLTLCSYQGNKLPGFFKLT